MINTTLIQKLLRTVLNKLFLQLFNFLTLIISIMTKLKINLLLNNSSPSALAKMIDAKLP